MANITLGERLAACASLVRRDAFLCDVGTDHALLPILTKVRSFVQKRI